MFYQEQKIKRQVSKKSLSYGYWLKFELIEFCKQNELSTQGSKVQIKHRIHAFLDKNVKDGTKLTSLKNKRRIIKKIS